MSTENGTDIKVRVGSDYATSKFVDGLTSNDLGLTRALRDVTNKYNSGWKAQAYGLGEGNISINANYDADAKTAGTYFAWEDFLDALINKTILTVHFTDGVTGHKRITASFLVASCPLSAPMEDNATFTVDLQMTGAPTISTIS